MKTEVADVKAVVLSDGSVMWVPPVNYLIRCEQEDDAVTSCVLKSVITQKVYDN